MRETGSLSVLDSYEDFFAYDPTTRGLRSNAYPQYGVDFYKLDELVDVLKDLGSRLLKTSEENLSKEIFETFRYRTLFLLLPHECIFSQPDEDKPIIRKHLDNLGVKHSPELLSAIKFFCSNFRDSRLGKKKKKGIVEVRTQYPHLFKKMMIEQNDRCKACGVPLIYGVNMELDHILPWHLGDDPNDGSNWQLLCPPCNQGKGQYPYYSFQAHSSNWMRPLILEETLNPSVRYAVLVRDGKCTKTGQTPKEVELMVEKRFDTGCMVFDNLWTVSKNSLRANQ